jgi:uncharacterized protein (DUF58 family)
MNLKNWLIKQSKKKSRIYILPTKMGGYLNGLIFLMFLLSVGYNNNLLLIFTLFLFGLNLVWVIQTHFYLNRLKLGSVQVEDSFALEKTLINIYWKDTPSEPYKWEFQLEGEKHQLPVSTLSSSGVLSVAQGTFPSRGLWVFEHLKVKTEMPFGLYQAWIYLPVKYKAFVYPERLSETQSLILKDSLEEGDYSSLRVGPHDIWNLGPYQGDESRKISWKHYARSGELVVKEGEELINSEITFKLNSYEQNKEFYLSQIATQMVHCSRTETAFFLETNDHRRISGLTECLRELSLC